MSVTTISQYLKKHLWSYLLIDSKIVAHVCSIRRRHRHTSPQHIFKCVRLTKFKNIK